MMSEVQSLVCMSLLKVNTVLPSETLAMPFSLPLTLGVNRPFIDILQIAEFTELPSGVKRRKSEKNDNTLLNFKFLNHCY